MSSIDHPPRKSAVIRHRRSLQVDVEQANAIPPRRTRLTNGRTHTTYKDLVSVLRGKGEATEALAHYQETGKSLGHGLGVVVKNIMQELAEPYTRKTEADTNDYSNIFEQDLSGEFEDMKMEDYSSEQNKPAQHVHASGDVVKERTDDDYEALFDDLPSPKK